MIKNLLVVFFLWLPITSCLYAQERLCPDGKRSYFGVCPEADNNSRPQQPIVPQLPTPTAPKPSPAVPARTGNSPPWGGAAVPASTQDAAVVLNEWQKADNRNACAPLAFASTGGLNGTPRRRYFGGGWGVSYDLPNKRDSFGVAGTGGEPETDAERLAEVKRWPFQMYFNDGSLVGYGLSGRGSYSQSNPNGIGEDSLAYLYISGQRCMYNVWSHISRDHLELLIGQLRRVKTNN